MSEATQSDVAVVLLGARGSIPVSGPEYLTYGGSTTCMAITEGDTIRALIDAGTGLTEFRRHGLELAGSVPVFLTHYHWDHIQGISMLGEVWAGACSVTFWGPGDPESMLTGSIRPPWFPVSLDDAPEPVLFEPISGGMSAGSAEVSSFEVNHPQGAVGYRVDGPNRSLAIVTDHESTDECDAAIAEALGEVDVLIHDAQYLPEEAADHKGWGHSTWRDAVAMAKRVHASELWLTSHGPGRSDADIDLMLADARNEFVETNASAPGSRIPL